MTLTLLDRVRGRTVDKPGDETGDTAAQDQTASTSTGGVTQADEIEASDADGTDETDEVDDGRKNNWLQRRREQRKLAGDFASYPHLLALKPKERYVFRSDYFEVDDSVGCILAYFHDDAAHDNYPPFWGIDRIPDGLDERVTAVVLEQVHRMDDKWVDSAITQSEKLDNLDLKEQEESGTKSSGRKAAKVSWDLETTIGELQDGASYLSVHNRLFLKAPTLAVLEESIDKVARLYIDRFGTLNAEPYAGEQRQELSNLFMTNEVKRGRGFHYTSTEFAGSYSLVTNGLNDRGGEYVGYMRGEVNQAAILMDVNAYEHHTVVADGSFNEFMARVRRSSMWCSKISQACMLSNGKVVHLILDGTDLDTLGPKFDRLTSYLDMNSGDVNMFELFGKEADELAVYPAHVEKLKLMFEQLSPDMSPEKRQIIRGALEKVVTNFYVEQGMWRHNAKAHREQLRVVGIPHDQLPRLRMFKSYLETALKTTLNASTVDPLQLEALKILLSTGNTMLSTNGDLFDNYTASAIDGVQDARRVIYDFARLLPRGRGIAMAQLVNVIGFAVGDLGEGDTVIIHGTEHIDDGVKTYLSTNFEALFERGGRVVYSYNDIDAMLADEKFNKFDAADYTLLGPMRDPTVKKYTTQLHQEIPPDLSHLITSKGENLTYLRRGASNVVFYLDLALGINPYREAQRRTTHLDAAKAAEAERLAGIMGDKPISGGGLTSGRQVVPSETASEPAPSKTLFKRLKKTSPTGDQSAATAETSSEQTRKKVLR